MTQFIEPYDSTGTSYSTHPAPSMQQLEMFLKKTEYNNKRLDQLVIFVNDIASRVFSENIVDTIKSSIVSEVNKIDFTEVASKLVYDKETLISENNSLKLEINNFSNRVNGLLSAVEDVQNELDFYKLPESIKKDEDIFYTFKNSRWSKVDNGIEEIRLSIIYSKITDDLWIKKDFNPMVSSSKLFNNLGKVIIEDEIPF